MKALAEPVADAVVKPEGGRGRGHAWRQHLTLLCMMVVVSFAVRATALALWRTGAINSEGAEYARIAENVRNGVGYVGIATPGSEVMFPPLFPLLIGMGSLVTHNYEWAGRLVSLVLGTFLPLPVFGIALRLFGRRPALVAAALTILHPLLINLSITVLSEGPYATLLLSAVWLLLRALDHASLTLWCFVGGAFGAAYLVRQEAVAPLLIAVIFALTAANISLGMKCKRAVAAITVFGLLTLPEVVFLYRSTGKIRLEEKSAINFAIGVRMLAEQTNAEMGRPLAVVRPEEAVDPQKVAEYGIDADLRGRGVWMRSNAGVVRELHVTPGEFASFLKKALRRNIRILRDQLYARWFGTPFLPGLALLGAFRRPWRPPMACRRLFVMLVPATAIMATFSVIHGLSPRNYFVLVPFLLIWGANGVVEMIRWTTGSVAAVGQWLSPEVAEFSVLALTAFVIIVFPLGSVRQISEFTSEGPATRLIKDVGLWIRQQQKGPVTIIDTSTPLAFHGVRSMCIFLTVGPS